MDIPVTGVLRDQVLTLEEMDQGKAISTTTLSAHGNVWSGIWRKGSQQGKASITFVLHRPGEPVVVATRNHRKTSVPCEGQENDGGVRAVRATTTVRIPVVLGLADRTFERELNARLQADAEEFQPMTCPIGVDVSFRVPLNAGGFLSVLFDKRNVVEAGICVVCEVFNENDAAGITAAVDAAVIARTTDFIDPNRLGAALPSEIRQATLQCVAGAQQPVDPSTLLEAFVLTAEGADYCYRWCENHLSGSRCERVSYKSLRRALKPNSPFSPLWKGADAADAG